MPLLHASSFHVGVMSQATKNKTYTPKNICSNASKDCSHGEYLASSPISTLMHPVSLKTQNMKVVDLCLGVPYHLESSQSELG